MTNSEIVALLAPHYTHEITVGRINGTGQPVGTETYENYAYLHCFDCESDIAEFDGVKN